MAEVGDRDQPLSAFVDDEPGVSPEARVPAGKLEPGDELELAGAGDPGVARVEVDRLGGEAERFGCCRDCQEQREK